MYDVPKTDHIQPIVDTTEIHDLTSAYSERGWRGKNNDESPEDNLERVITEGVYSIEVHDPYRPPRKDDVNERPAGDRREQESQVARFAGERNDPTRDARRRTPARGRAR